MVEFGVFPDELLQIIDDYAVIGVIGDVVGGEGREETGEAAAASGGRGLGAAGSGVGLTAGAGALVEEGRVDLGSDEVSS